MLAISSSKGPHWRLAAAVSGAVVSEVHSLHDGGVAAVLTLLLSHQKAAELERTLTVWHEVTGPENILVAYGGSRSDYSAVSSDQKIFIEDPRLRTKDHQRERQSCTGVFQQTAEWLAHHRQFEYIHFLEFDHIPLVPDLHDRVLERFSREDADVLAHHLQRIDGTSHPHYLCHAHDPRFHEFYANLTSRAEPGVILSMLGTGSFWSRASFNAVARYSEPVPVYFEVHLPTLAHHLGFRLRDFGDQNKFVSHRGDFGAQLAECHSAGAWTAHPVKCLPAESLLITK